VSGSRTARLADTWRLLWLSARVLGGRWVWAAPLIVLLWPAFQYLFLALGWEDEQHTSGSVQNGLIGFPLNVLAIGLGVRIIGGEIDRRTLEIAYTVPGGAQRVWLSKLVAAFGILVAALAALGAVAFAFFTAYPPGALYGAVQSAVFFLALSMAFSALLRNEITAALVTAGAFTVLGMLSFAMGRASPMWNPASEGLVSMRNAEILAATVQNRIGYALVVAALVALAIGRAERREKLLAG
jgi:ABC-type transport system involved in multi-copper enzyme maturation permease subunit